MATNLQQKGLETTSSGKAGFITALYIVLVPIAGIFLKNIRPRPFGSVWRWRWPDCTAFASKGFSITMGDFYVLLCAFCFTVHILVIDHFTQRWMGWSCPARSFLW